MKRCLLVVIVLLMSSPAAGQYNTDPDVIGIYFDAEANDVAVMAEEFASVETYLMITNPTAVSIRGWECTLDFDSAACVVVGGWDYAGEALNICTAPEFTVGLAEPVPASTVTTLLTVTLFVLDVAGTMLTVTAAPDPSTADNLPLYVDGADLDNLILLENSTGYGVGDVILPCASINVWTKLESWSWGEVKALYR